VKFRWTIFRSAFFATLFVFLWMYYVPSLLVPNADWRLPAAWTAAPIIGLTLLLIGSVMMLLCVFSFATTGEGTPAPFDPPRRLVSNRLYAHVRNPMYLGMGTALIGEALLFPGRRNAILGMTAFCFLAVNLFILLYEEPTLTNKFGASYEEYKRNVPRWIPRLTAYRPAGQVGH
jgi:protein-S-isoprenylcysteine O-methyltransferase Ste14